MKALQKLDLYANEGTIPQKYADNTKQFYFSYINAVSQNPKQPDYDELFDLLIDLIKEQC